MNAYLEEIAPRGSMLYYSLLFVPHAQRELILAIHRFYNEIQFLGRDCKSPIVAEQKINYWREEINQLYQHNPRHPITTTVLPWIQQNNINPGLWLNQIEESAQSLQLPRLATWDDFILMLITVRVYVKF